MKPIRLLKYSVLAASIAALGGSLVAGNAAAGSDRDGKREVIKFRHGFRGHHGFGGRH